MSSFLRFIISSFLVSKFKSFQVSKFPKFQDSKIPRFPHSKIPKFQNSKTSNSQNFKIQTSKHKLARALSQTDDLRDFKNSKIRCLVQTGSWFSLLFEVILRNIRELTSWHLQTSPKSPNMFFQDFDLKIKILEISRDGSPSLILRDGSARIFSKFLIVYQTFTNCLQIFCEHEDVLSASTASWVAFCTKRFGSAFCFGNYRSTNRKL